MRATLPFVPLRAADPCLGGWHRFGLVWTLAVVSVGIGVAASPPAATTQTFRAGVDMVLFDVTVLDRERRPVRGLAAADFSVTENDLPRTVHSVTEVNVPTVDLSMAPWFREASVDVVSNSLESRRMVVIVLNDAYVSPELSVQTSKIANAIIDQLGPADMAAIVGTQLTRMENFTHDRAKLRAAVSTFVGQNTRSDSISLKCQPDPRALAGAGLSGRISLSAVSLDQCFVPAMSRAANVLATAAPGRKVVMLIGGYLLGQNAGFGTPPLVDDNSRHTGLGRERELIERLHAANATVYVFDPRGVGPGVQESDELGLADETGGRVAAGSNSPESLVPEIFAESSSYYLLAYATTLDDSERRFRRVRVGVNRPELQVVARQGYFGPAAGSTRAGRRSDLPPEDEALARALPSGDQPMTVAVVPIADQTEGQLGGAVIAVVSLHEPLVEGTRPNQGTSRTVRLLTAAFDAATFRSRGERRDELVLRLEPDATQASDYEVTSMLPLRPGRYELRFAVERLGRAGSVFVSVVVPNFRGERLSMSGVLLDKQPSRRRVGGVSLSRLVPFLPTTERGFSPSDTVRMWVAVYQGVNEKVAPVRMTTEIRDTADRTAHAETTVLHPDQFKNHAAQYEIDVPLTRLRTGDYLLVTRAVLDERSTERTVRFTVK